MLLLLKKKKTTFFLSCGVKTERELSLCGFFGPNFKWQHFQDAQNEYFFVHGGTDFDVGTLSVKNISLEIMILVCCLSWNGCICMSLQLINYKRILYLVKISIRDKERTWLLQELIGLSRLTLLLDYLRISYRPGQYRVQYLILK